MKLSKLTPQKNTAQAMVEFAIVLPILLLLLYGLLEAGRLLFMYSTIVTASRQAARYGSATGDGINPGVPRYQDCAGIRVAANRVDFLNAFDEYDVIIQHDTGPGTTATYYCTNVANNEPDPSLTLGPTDTNFQPAGNTERIIVTIEGDFNPIVPRIVPFIARTEAGGNPITAISARTIITGVSIEVTPPPGSGPAGPSPTGLTLTVSANPTTFSSAGQSITLTFTLTNTGTDPIPGPFTITHTFGSVTCTAPGTDPDLAPGDSAICQTGTLTITQAQLDAGVPITITGKANSGGTVESNEASTTITPGVTPGLTLAKSASTTLATVGDSITYTFTLTNSGNVTLSPPYTVSDDVMGPIDCSSASGNLAPGASIICAPVYVVNSNNVRQNQVVNTATATALFGTQTVTSNQVSATVDIYTGRLFLTVSASPASTSQVGQIITYTYTIKNNGNQALTNPYSLSVSLPNSGCSFSTDTLAPGASKTCTGTYAVTQADFEAGVIRNTVTASATDNNKTESSNTVTNAVTVTGQNPALSIVSSASPTAPTPPEKTMTVGLPINYSYTVTNVGNITLSSLAVTDLAVGNLSCTGTSLAPGASITCTGTHPIVEADLDAGIITSQATASALYAAKNQTVSASAPPIIVVTYEGTRLRLQVTANPVSFIAAGDWILYTYTLTNTGSVPLTGFSVADNKVSVTCTLPPDNILQRGASLTCTGQYQTTAADMSTDSVVSTAIAKSSDGTQIVESNSVTTTVLNSNTVCTAMTAGPLTLTKSTNTMSMTITNTNNYAVAVQDVFVAWNHDTGSKTGDKTLRLQGITLGSNPAWTGDLTGPSQTVTPSGWSIPANSTFTITFTFHRTYDNWDEPPTEVVQINFSTAGCGFVRQAR